MREFQNREHEYVEVRKYSETGNPELELSVLDFPKLFVVDTVLSVSYTHLRAHET